MLGTNTYISTFEWFASHVRAVVATLGGQEGAAGRADKWRHLYAGFTVWLSRTEAKGEFFQSILDCFLHDVSLPSNLVFNLQVYSRLATEIEMSHLRLGLSHEETSSTTTAATTGMFRSRI